MALSVPGEVEAEAEAGVQEAVCTVPAYDGVWPAAGSTPQHHSLSLSDGQDPTAGLTHHPRPLHHLDPVLHLLDVALVVHPAAVQAPVWPHHSGDDQAVVAGHPEPVVPPDHHVAHAEDPVLVLPGRDTRPQPGHEAGQEDLAPLLQLEGEGGGDQDGGRPLLSPAQPSLSWSGLIS